MRISAADDGGNILVLDATSPGDVQLAIRPDARSPDLQWFSFRLSGARGVPCRLRLTNAHAASYARAWSGFQAVCSADGEQWRRVATDYVGGELILTLTPAADVVWLAAFAPYSGARRAGLLGWAQQRGARVETLGQTPDGADLDVVVAGQGPVSVWVVARQHPGETMAEWSAEGLLRRLLDHSDDAARALWSRATVRVVPCMNPDGARRGHLRTNALGADLNRCWAAPSAAHSPEVLAVRAAMLAGGVDICLDLHGDETLPYCFASRNVLGVPGITAAQQARFLRFLAVLEAESPAFQTAHGYPTPAAGTADLRLCSSWLQAETGCLAVTLEQPFKDDANHPDTVYGWSPARSQRLGADILAALARTVVEEGE